jgi:hypothetical protein
MPTPLHCVGIAQLCVRPKREKRKWIGREKAQKAQKLQTVRVSAAREFACLLDILLRLLRFFAAIPMLALS